MWTLRASGNLNAWKKAYVITVALSSAAFALRNLEFSDKEHLICAELKAGHDQDNVVVYVGCAKEPNLSRNADVRTTQRPKQVKYIK